MVPALGRTVRDASLDAEMEALDAVGGIADVRWQIEDEHRGSCVDRMGQRGGQRIAVMIEQRLDAEVTNLIRVGQRIPCRAELIPPPSSVPARS